MALATLSIDIVAKLASLEAGLDKANRVLQKNADAMEQRFGRIGGLATSVAGGIASAFAGISFVELVKSTNAGVDALNDFKDATGASIETGSALEDLAARTGTGFDTVTTSLVKFNKTLGDAKEGSAAGNIFKFLNLDVEKLKQLDPAEALRQTAVALAGVAEGGNKSRLILELFGKSTKEIAPYLNDLATKTELVGTVTAEQAAAAEKFAQNLAALEKNALDLARAFSGPLVEALNKFAGGVKAYGSITGFLKDNFRFDQASEQGAGLASTNQELAGIEKRLQRISAIEQRPGVSDVLLRRYAAERAELEDQVKVLQSRRQYIVQNAADPSGGATELARRGRGPRQAPTIEDSKKPSALRDKKERAEIFGPELPPETLAALKRIEQTDTAKVAKLRAELQALLAIQAGGGNAGEAIAELTIELEELAPGFKLAAEEKQRLNALLANTPSANFDDLQRDIDFLRDQMERGIVTAQQYAEAINLRTGAGASQAVAELSEFNKNLISGTQDLLSGTLRDVGTTGFRDLDRKFGDLMLSLSAQAVAADLTEKLFGKDGKGLETLGQRITDQLNEVDFSALSDKLGSLLDGLGSAVSGLFSGSGGGSGGDYLSMFSGLFAGAFADGGFAAPNKVALVGERGPELIWTGNRGKTVQPLSQAPAQGSPIYNISVTAPTQPGMSRDTALQQGAAFGAGIQRALARNG